MNLQKSHDLLTWTAALLDDLHESRELRFPLRRTVLSDEVTALRGEIATALRPQNPAPRGSAEASSNASQVVEIIQGGKHVAALSAVEWALIRRPVERLVRRVRRLAAALLEAVDSQPLDTDPDRESRGGV